MNACTRKCRLNAGRHKPAQAAAQANSDSRAHPLLPFAPTDHVAIERGAGDAINPRAAFPPARERQYVGADVILAERLDGNSVRRLPVGDELGKPVASADHGTPNAAEMP